MIKLDAAKLYWLLTAQANDDWKATNSLIIKLQDVGFLKRIN